MAQVSQLGGGGGPPVPAPCRQADTEPVWGLLMGPCSELAALGVRMPAWGCLPAPPLFLQSWTPGAWPESCLGKLPVQGSSGQAQCWLQEVSLFLGRSAGLEGLDITAEMRAEG